MEGHPKIRPFLRPEGRAPGVRLSFR